MGGQKRKTASLSKAPPPPPVSDSDDEEESSSNSEEDEIPTAPPKPATSKASSKAAPVNDAAESSSSEDSSSEEEEEAKPPPPKKTKKVSSSAAPVAVPKKAISSETVVSKSKAKKTEKSRGSHAPVPIAAPVMNGVASPPRPSDADWTKEETNRLLDRISARLPPNDVLKFQTQQERMDWEAVAGEGRSAADCKAKWAAVLKKLRTFKTMSELVREALASEKAQEPLAPPQGRPPAPPPPESYPDPDWVRFFKSKSQEYKRRKATNEDGVRYTDFYKNLSERFKSMSSSEKEQIRRDHLNDMRAFIAPVGTKVEKMKPPAKPSTPLQLFVNYAKDKMKHKDKFVSKSGLEQNNLLRRKWSVMDDDKKTFFILQAVESARAYEVEVKRLKIESPDQTAGLADTVKVLSKHEQLLLDKHEGIPTKPPGNGYSIFAQEILTSEKLKGIEPSGRMTKVAQLWKEMPDTEKTVYNVKAKSAMEQFKIAVAQLPPEIRSRLLGSKKESKKEATPKEDSAAAASPPVSPPRPQKPFDAIRVFIEAKREKFRRRHPDASASELNRMLTAEYNELSEKKKEKYRAKALRLKEDHEEEMKVRNASAKSKSDSEESKPPPPKKDKRQKKGKKPEKESEVVSHAPAPAAQTAPAKKGKGPKKPPMNGYTVFSSECFRDAELMKGVPNTEKMSLISRKWKELDESEHQAYNLKAKFLVDEYVRNFPDSDFAVAHLKRAAKKAAVAATPAAATPAAASSAASSLPATAKNNKLQSLKAVATSTPKAKTKDDDDDDDDDEEEEEESDSEGEPEVSNIAKVSSSPKKTTGSIATPTAKKDDDDEDDDDEEEEEFSEESSDEDAAAGSPAKPTPAAAAAAAPSKSVAAGKAEASDSDEEEEEEDDSSEEEEEEE